MIFDKLLRCSLYFCLRWVIASIRSRRSRYSSGGLLRDCIHTWTPWPVVANRIHSRRSHESSSGPIRDGSGSIRLSTDRAPSAEVSTLSSMVIHWFSPLPRGVQIRSSDPVSWESDYCSRKNYAKERPFLSTNSCYAEYRYCGFDQTEGELSLTC